MEWYVFYVIYNATVCSVLEVWVKSPNYLY